MHVFANPVTDSMYDFLMPGCILLSSTYNSHYGTIYRGILSCNNFDTTQILPTVSEPFGATVLPSMEIIKYSST